MTIQEKISRYVSVKQLANLYPAFSEGSIRWILFHREYNGASNFVIKIGKKIVIDLEKFDYWLNKNLTEKN